jgi:predicted ATPase
MVGSIDFERYRVFSSKQSLRIAPLTVVFGWNNTGKSAILKLPIIVQSAINCDLDNVFAKQDQSGLVLCDEYRDVVYGKGNHAVGLQFKDEKDEATVSMKFIAETIAEKSHSRIEEIQISDGQRTWVVNTDDNGVLRVADSGETVTFSGIKPREGTQKEWVKTVLDKLKMTIDYIGPVRFRPERYFSLSEHLDGTSGIDGRVAYTYLVNDSQNALHPLLDKVSKWYEDNFSGWKMEVGKTRYPVFSIELTNEKLPNINILDAGFGIQQSLPIVVAAYRRYDKPTLVIIEEPETHLNPSAHAQMGELLATEAKADPNKKVLIETHSQNLMIRLRTLIAKGIVTREDIALYYVDYDKEACKSNLREVIIKDNGEVVNWPDHMFRETLDEALALRNAQLMKNV